MMLKTWRGNQRRVIFHGPVNDRDCRRVVSKFAKKYGGKFSYLSFFNARRMDHLDGWFSENTVGKAAYCAAGVPLAQFKSWREVRAMIREAKALGHVEFIRI